MANPDLRALVPAGAVQAFCAGDEGTALTLLRRARDAQSALSLPWAVLERLVGLVSIHMLREVEGTFALERADPLLDAAAQACADSLTLDWPTLDWLEETGTAEP